MWDADCKNEAKKNGNEARGSAGGDWRLSVYELSKPKPKNVPIVKMEKKLKDKNKKEGTVVENMKDNIHTKTQDNLNKIEDTIVKPIMKRRIMDKKPTKNSPNHTRV